MSAVNLEVKLPEHVTPTSETNEQLIKKFLRECSKEGLMQFIYDRSTYTRRFEKKSVKTRQKQLRYKRTAKKNNQLDSNTPEQKHNKKV